MGEKENGRARGRRARTPVLSCARYFQAPATQAILNTEGALETSTVHFMICVPFRTLNDELVGTLRYFTKDTNKDRITIYLSVYITPKEATFFLKYKKKKSCTNWVYISVPQVSRQLLELRFSESVGKKLKVRRFYNLACLH